MGRFQPFHLGHLNLVKQILKDYDEVIIAITSSQFNYLEKDPFTAGERVEMITQSLKDEKINMSKCFIIPLENQFNVATWASYLKSSLPKFDKVITGNKYVQMLLRDSDIEVAEPKFFEREKYKASKIRHMIAKDNAWENFVPKAVARIIKEINGVNRLKVIANTDTNPTEY